LGKLIVQEPAEKEGAETLKKEADQTKTAQNVIYWDSWIEVCLKQHTSRQEALCTSKQEEGI
jgi:hypothetical protein